MEAQHDEPWQFGIRSQVRPFLKSLNLQGHPVRGQALVLMVAPQAGVERRGTGTDLARWLRHSIRGRAGAASDATSYRVLPSGASYLSMTYDLRAALAVLGSGVRAPSAPPILHAGLRSDP